MTAQKELLVGVDVGTTRTKAAVVGLDGRELSWGSAPTVWRTVLTGAETSPWQFLRAMLRAVGEALEGAPAGKVLGVAVTSLAETAVLLGADGMPVGPCIAWHDRRGGDEARNFVEVFGEGAFEARIGLGLSSMPTLFKLAWLRRHDGPPAVQAMNVADWLVYCLGADRASEASLSCRTGALSLKDRSWWAEALSWAGAAPGLFPPVAQAGQCLGHFQADRLCGLPGEASGGSGLSCAVLEQALAGAALASAGHDHLCGAVGAGAINQEQVYDSCGTAEALVRVVPQLAQDQVAQLVRAGVNVGWHTVPGHYAVVKGHSLGLLLESVLALLGIAGPEQAAELDTEALSTAPGTLVISQESPYAAPVISGIGVDASPAALWTAALQAVCEFAPAALAPMAPVAGPAKELVLSGGWANFAGLRRAKSTLLPRCNWPDVVEAGARGASLFAGLAASAFSDPAGFPRPPERCCYGQEGP